LYLRPAARAVAATFTAAGITAVAATGATARTTARTITGTTVGTSSGTTAVTSTSTVTTARATTAATPCYNHVTFQLVILDIGNHRCLIRVAVPRQQVGRDRAPGRKGHE
jgi:hypothetical protein